MKNGNICDINKGHEYILKRNSKKINMLMEKQKFTGVFKTRGENLNRKIVELMKQK